MTSWRYGVMRRNLDDGPVYGMHELHFENGLQYWTADPYWTEQDKGDFVITIDRLESNYRATGNMPTWAMGYTGEQFLSALESMRHDVGLKSYDEDEIYRGWGE